MTSSFQVSAILALKGLLRGNRFTTGLTVIIMGLVFVMILFQPSILGGFIKAANDQVIDYSYANIAIEPKEHQPYIGNVRSLREKINQIPGVVATSPRYTAAGTFTYKETSLGKSLISVTPADEQQVLKIPDRIIAGEFLTDGDRDEIVIGALLAGHRDSKLDKVKSLGGVEVGDSIDVTFSNGAVKRFHVKGIFQTNSDAVDQTAYITNKEMESVTGLSDKASLVLVKLSANGNEEKFRTTMNQYGIQEPIKTWAEEGAGFVADINTSFGLVISIMTAFSLVIGAIVIFIVIFINTVNKRKQIAIMKAIGIKKEIIINSYLIQVACLSMAGIIVGIILFEGITWYLTMNPLRFPIGDVPPLIDSGRILQSVISLIIVSIVGGYIPAWKTASEEILDGMRG
ncbi:MAG: FtsX-like permease family protein [Methanoregulaceae archaeon]|nr:FtsX-like permease family protein [Methanoregulaceae archaeon]